MTDSAATDTGADTGTDAAVDPAADAGTGEFDSIGIAMPHEWIEIPLDRGGFDRFHTELAARWVEGGWDRTTRRRAEILLRRIRRDLVRAGLHIAGVFVSSPSDEERSADAKFDVDAEQDPSAADVLFATCSVTTFTQEELGSTLPLTLGNLVIAFGRTAPDPRGGNEERITNLEPPQPVDLPAGRSVRLRRLYELPDAGPLPERFYGESYLTPIGDDGARCLVTHFTTINLQVARLFSELFETMAGTLKLFRPDDPTDVDSDWVDLFDEP